MSRRAERGASARAPDNPRASVRATDEARARAGDEARGSARGDEPQAFAVRSPEEMSTTTEQDVLVDNQQVADER